VIALRPGWSVRAHPVARQTFGIPLNDPNQIAELDAFIASCHPGMVLFDIGAHFGLFSLAALHYGGPSARAVAVEASRSAARVLRIHAGLNHVTGRLEAIHAAAADRPGWRDMLPVGVIADGYYLEPDAGRPARDLVRVRAVTVDGLVDELGRAPTHLKIDVEGAETGVLQGAQRTLAGDRPPLVFLELHNEICRKAGRDPADCVATLTQHGYNLQTSQGQPLTLATATEPPVIRLVAGRPARHLHAS
jgi:FkbM family methyltransferase